MNWLAHVVLSPPDPAFRLGNLLADAVRRPERHPDLPDAFARGVRRHRAIDAFTERHPAVRESRARIVSLRPRYAGIAVDFLYDHLLATSWERRCHTPFDAFCDTFLADARACALPLPDAARGMLDWICATDVLRSYRREEGIAEAMGRFAGRMERRLGVAVPLERALDDLRADRAGFDADFDAFWPELAAHVGEEFRADGA
mgnify:CR=1 FL=1